jgi:hypothetical protein
MRFAWPPVNRLSSQTCAAPPAAPSGTLIAVENEPSRCVAMPGVRVMVPALSAKPIVTVSDAGHPEPVTVVEEFRPPEEGATDSEPVASVSDAVLAE